MIRFAAVLGTFKRRCAGIAGSELFEVCCWHIWDSHETSHDQKYCSGEKKKKSVKTDREGGRGRRQQRTVHVSLLLLCFLFLFSFLLLLLSLLANFWSGKCPSAPKGRDVPEARRRVTHGSVVNTSEPTDGCPSIILSWLSWLRRELPVTKKAHGDQDWPAVHVLYSRPTWLEAWTATLHPESALRFQTGGRHQTYPASLSSIENTLLHFFFFNREYCE